MESTKSCGGMMVVLVVALMVMMAANEIHAQIYSCWGGCYNQCILRGMSTNNGTSNINGTSSNSNGTSTADQPPPPQPQPQNMFSCYYQCLNGCVPRSAGDYGYYCQIGCNLNRCPPNSSYDGAELEKCYGTCADLCKNM